MALAGECGDPVLQNLVVTGVLPAPNDSRLLVEVVSSLKLEVHDVLERLERAGGLLRRAVAAAIVRKRVPELTFRVCFAPMAGEVGDGR